MKVIGSGTRNTTQDFGNEAQRANSLTEPAEDPANTCSELELVTVVEIAGMLKVPVSWVYERTRRRGRERIPHVKLGKICASR